MLLFRLFFIFCLSALAVAQPSMRGIPLMDLDPAPDDYPVENPFATLVLWAGFSDPVLDHTGKPHALGNLFQVIVDGGNGTQDPPTADGSPGGDDSLAYGNYNLFRVNGLEDPAQNGKDVGLYFSHKYFIPYVLSRGYYLRLWEGKDAKTAPYYQDTKEYKTEADAGGGFYFFKENEPPVDVTWTFGTSKPRPKKS